MSTTFEDDPDQIVHIVRTHNKIINILWVLNTRKVGSGRLQLFRSSLEILNRDGSTKELAVYGAGGSDQGLHTVTTTGASVMGRRSNVHDVHECLEFGEYGVIQTRWTDPVLVIQQQQRHPTTNQE